MYNVYQYIEDIDIRNGETKRVNCPECKSYKTFTVTNNMGSLVWNCYKASCSVRGSSRVHMTVEEIRDINKVSQVGTSFEMPEYIVPHNHRREVMNFCELWDLDVDTVDL